MLREIHRAALLFWNTDWRNSKN